MTFRDVAQVAVESIATHLGEAVTLDGHCIRAAGVRIGATTSSALAGVQVRSSDATLSILNVDADRIGLRKGMDIEAREQKFKVRDFARGNSGWTQLELE